MLVIIVVLYNSEPFIKAFLSSLLKAAPNNSEIFLVDNHSSDRTIDFVHGYTDSRIRLIKNAKNIGFAKAVAQVVDQLPTDTDILLLNPDCTVPKASIKSLYLFYRQHIHCVVGGAYQDYDRTKKTTRTAVSSVSFTSCLLELTSLGKIPLLKDTNGFWEKNISLAKQVVAVSGGFMMFSKKVWDDVGGFDEKFFLYLEDVDFCMRARQQGYKVWHYPKAAIKHYAGGSSISQKGFVDESAWLASRDYFFKKHFRAPQYFLYQIFSRLELIILLFTSKVSSSNLN